MASGARWSEVSLTIRKILGRGLSGVKDSSLSTALGDRTSTPWAPSPPSTFCQEYVLTSHYTHYERRGGETGGRGGKGRKKHARDVPCDDVVPPLTTHVSLSDRSRQDSYSVQYRYVINTEVLHTLGRKGGRAGGERAHRKKSVVGSSRKKETNLHSTENATYWKCFSLKPDPLGLHNSHPASATKVITPHKKVSAILTCNGSLHRSQVAIKHTTVRRFSVADRWVSLVQGAAV